MGRAVRMTLKRGTTKMMNTITTEQLNAVANLLGTTDKNVVFSACIKTLVENGMKLEAAFDYVCGHGRFADMVSSL